MSSQREGGTGDASVTELVDLVRSMVEQLHALRDEARRQNELLEIVIERLEKIERSQYG